MGRKYFNGCAKVKSKIECWGPSNDIKKQKIVKYNIEKENKKITNISKKNNSNIDSKENTALHSASKKDADKSKNKVVDMNKIEEKAKKNALKSTSNIKEFKFNEENNATLISSVKGENNKTKRK